MDTIFATLGPWEVLKLQAANTWFYSHAVKRSQSMWRVRQRFFYFCAHDTKLFVYDALLQTGERLMNAAFDFASYQAVQIGPDHLYDINP